MVDFLFSHGHDTSYPCNAGFLIEFIPKNGVFCRDGVNAVRGLTIASYPLNHCLHHRPRQSEIPVWRRDHPYYQPYLVIC